ncbi:MAG: DUF1616 domain-containing protein [Candidatus Bathyarchaeota archaeon]|nr:DUF1616 domain-containing protein [Candidatus Bathyarchaeota archaeon]
MINIKTIQDLLLIDALSVAFLLTVTLVPDSSIRTVLGLPFILFFPGYVLVGALFPAKAQLDLTMRMVLSACLSIAIAPLIGLCLNYSPFGITLVPLVVSLFCFTGLLSMAAFLRRKNLPLEQTAYFKHNFALPKWGVMTQTDKIFSIAIIVALVSIVGFASFLAVNPKIGERFTEFYVLGPNGTLSDYPVNLTLGQTGTVILGLNNHEYQNETYTITVQLENQTQTKIENIHVPDNTNWTQPYTFKAEKTGNAMKLEFLLYKENILEPYRILHLYLTVKPPE